MDKSDIEENLDALCTLVIVDCEIALSNLSDIFELYAITSPVQDPKLKDVQVLISRVRDYAEKARERLFDSRISENNGTT